jgi:hypothetical protein
MEEFLVVGGREGRKGVGGLVVVLFLVLAVLRTAWR